jgi:hypothetical protein
MLAAVGEILLFTLSFVLGIVVPANIVSWDVAHLRGPQLERAWPDAGLWSAVVVFGPLCLPVHFIRTRRSWLGLGLGVFWLLCALVVTGAPVEALGRIFNVGE